MKNKTIIQEALDKYQYKKDKPIFQNGTYSVYNGIQTETQLPVTIKTLQSYHPELPNYLKKIKDTKADHVIKVYEFVAQANQLAFVTEQVKYGTLKNALKKCQRFEDNDGVFVTKILLNAHIQLLRNDCNWFGNQQDIQFTDTGIKLSWNNGTSYNLANPFPTLIERIAGRPQSASQGLLPFPKNKNIVQLIKVSKENASELSLHPLLKKKDKVAKKIGKGWFGFKQTKSKNEYFDQTDYTAISKQHGLVRVKVYEQGQLDPTVVNWNKTKNTFTLLYDHYDQNGHTITVSDYSNDGSMQSYVTKLKGANLTLKEDQIQFLFYSLFEPLKQVQESSTKAIRMMHIKNIYIENGTPKIGDPIPLNSNISTILRDRQDVPDFYSKQFKADPQKKQPRFDTYSLGVLLYKLMYTEYPIFPKDKVHIPTTPNYNNRLKTTLQIFLDEGGTLKQIESRIQVSETVQKKVKENKQKLQQDKKKSKKKQKSNKDSSFFAKDMDEESQVEKQSMAHISVQEHEEHQEEDDIGCFATIWQKLQIDEQKGSSNRNQAFASLEESPYKIYRLSIKIIVTLLLYLFLFYFFYIQNTIYLFSSANLLNTLSVPIATQNYTITTTDSVAFYTSFNLTDKTVADLENMGCFIDNHNGGVKYSDLAYDSSPAWIGFTAGGLITMMLLLSLRCLQLSFFDIVRVKYNWDKGISNFNVSNFILYSLFWCDFIHTHFYVFNFIFFSMTQPCLGSTHPYHSLLALFQDTSTFLFTYIVTLCLQFLILVCFTIALIKNQKIPYNKLLNPIIVITPLLLICWIFIRVGVMSDYFYPSVVNDNKQTIKGYFRSGNYIGILGVIPQIIYVIQLIIGLLIDGIFWLGVDKRRQMLILDNSGVSVNQQDELVVGSN